MYPTTCLGTVANDAYDTLSRAAGRKMILPTFPSLLHTHLPLRVELEHTFLHAQIH